jgi:tetratricopeptide (TPR) repeat protein
MERTDSRGLQVATQSFAALEKYELATRQVLGYAGNPLATIDEALAEDPDFAAAHAFKADLAVMSSERGALPIIRDSLAALERLGDRTSARERGHGAAAKAWLEGDFARAAHLYGAVAIEHPRDLVAIQAAHVIDFYLGDSLMLRDRIAQALPYWNHEVPGFGYLLGMHAFGLEETGNYGRAEDVGRHALALNAKDPWAVHAVQHVFEMQGRIHDGMEWLNATAPDWDDSALAFHNWWHLALHHLELGDIPAALDLYDRLVHPKDTTVALELVDASQLLARIALRGANVGTRWEALADCWEKTEEGGFYVFNDLHALLAYAFAGREEPMNRMLVSLEASAAGTGTNAENVRAAGLSIARAIVAMAAGRPAEALEALLPMRSRAYRIGGSHAQRDLVQLTLIGAALAAGNGRLARALAAERTEQKPASPHNWRLTARALEAQGATAEARKASEHAELRRRAQLRRNAA